MNNQTLLKGLRSTLANFGQSELEIQNNQEALKDLFGQIQELRKEMIVAKRESLREIESQYLSTIEEIERRYAFMIKLTSGA